MIPFHIKLHSYIILGDYFLKDEETYHNHQWKMEKLYKKYLIEPYIGNIEI